MSAGTNLRPDTLCIHAGQEPDPNHGAVMTPIVLASTFAQDGPAVFRGPYDYSRAGNPTRTALEGCLAGLEGAKHGLAFGSGCAATTALLMTLRTGDHVLCSDDVYGGTFRIFDKVMKQWGLAASFVDMSDPAKVREHVRPETKMIWLETPSNPMLKIIDIAALADVAKKANATLVVDNTFATPMLQRPLDLGAAVAVHSTTKYLNGHSDVVGGAVLTSNDEIAEKVRFLQKSTGGVPSPFDCYMVLRGLKTLGVRMRQHVKSASVLVEHLSKQKLVSKVFYPGLPEHAGHAVAAKQMKGFGGMITVDLRVGAKGTAPSAAFLKALQIFTCAESLGGVESLAELPAIMTHASLTAEARKELGIGDGLIRLSVGLEDVDDLRDDLDRGFRAMEAAL